MHVNMVLTFESEDKSLIVTIQVKATEQYFLLMLLFTLFKFVLTFESVDEILKCDHSNESWVVLPCSTVCFSVS